MLFLVVGIGAILTYRVDEINQKKKDGVLNEVSNGMTVELFLHVLEYHSKYCIFASKHIPFYTMFSVSMYSTTVLL